ncbi:MAG: peptide ABC transporter substrate-binding protein, partial [Oscillospiraceae bacterium]
MKSNRFLLLLLIAVFSIFFVACGKSSHHLSYDIDAAPTNLDPQSAGDYSSQLVIYNMFEGLVRIGADGSIKPAAAERFEVSDD